MLLRLTAIRRKRGLTQQGMADLIQVPASVLCRWESGKAYPPIPRLFQIAEKLNIKPGDLLSDSAATAGSK